MDRQPWWFDRNLDEIIGENPIILNNVYIGAKGSVFNEQKQPIYLNNIKETHESAKFHKSQKIHELKGEYIYMLSEHDIQVYGHIGEDFSRLRFFEDDKFKKCSVLKNVGHFTSWQGLSKRECLTKHLEFFGYPPSRQKELTLSPSPSGITYKIDTLHLAPRTINVESINFFTQTWRKALSLPQYKNKNNKIYLSRPHRPDQRAVLNNSEVEKYLRQEGFYIWTGKENLEDQVHLFRDADVIIGPHGAAFFNCIFCQNKPLILEFMPSSRSVYMFRNQSHIIGNKNHKVIECDSDKNWNHEINIDIIKNEILAIR